MSVYSVYIISESGSLQMYYDRSTPTTKVEKTLSYPLPLIFKNVDGKVVVDFGATDDIKVGYCVLGVNGVPAKGSVLEDGRDILEVFSNPSNFPIKINFGLPPLSPNDRITLASMFQAIHQMSRILTPVTALSKLDDKSGPGSNGSGIQTLETPECRLHCYESITGAKFLLVTDHRIPANARDALKLVYSAYTDYVLKNPFYSQNQPFNFEFFNEKVKKICEQVERGIFT